MKIIIGQHCDGFSVEIISEGKSKWYNFFDQEDESVDKLVEVFEILGVESYFEEHY